MIHVKTYFSNNFSEVRIVDKGVNNCDLVNNSIDPNLCGDRILQTVTYEESSHRDKLIHELQYEKMIVSQVFVY